MRVDKIYMEITTSCNMQCLYCYNDSGKKNYYMSFLELKKIMDAFLTNGISSVGISGGEPLLHPEFEKIMEYLVNKDCSKVVVTNGLLAPQKLTKFLLSPEAKTDIQLSLDGGSASVNDQIRGVGHYQLVVDYMKLLAEQGYKTGLARMTISRINQKEVESFIDLCLQYAFFPTFSFVVRSGRARDSWEETLLTYNERLKIIDQIRSVSLQN